LICQTHHLYIKEKEGVGKQSHIIGKKKKVKVKMGWVDNAVVNTQSLKSTSNSNSDIGDGQQYYF
jgi:hypothetical protein